MENKFIFGVVGILLLAVLIGALSRGEPTNDDFESALRKTNFTIETFTGQNLKDMNSLVQSGKSGSLVFSIIARAVVYANGALTKKQALAASQQAQEEMTTFKVDGVLVSVWRYAFGWQALATLAIEDKIRAKDMNSTLGNFCREPTSARRITCSKYVCFVRNNFFITISDIKEKVIVSGGRAVDYVPWDETKVQAVHDAILNMKI